MPAKRGVTLLAASAVAFASLAWADDDDGDKKRRRHRNGRHTEVHVHHHHHYWYLPSGAVLERGSPPPPPAAFLEHPLPGQPQGSRVPESFPKESRAERFSAKERQKGILEHELAAEEELLARARKNLAAQDAEIHERNVAALRRELGNLNR